MKIQFQYGTGVLTLPKENTVKNLSSAEMSDLKFLLFLAEDPDSFDINGAAKALDLTEEEIVSAIAFWEKAGVISIGNAPVRRASKAKREIASVLSKEKMLTKNELPEYSGEELASVLKSTPSLSSLISACQQILGKILTVPETRIIVGLYDFLHLEDEYILSLCSWCQSKNKTSLRYIEKTALALVDKGISTPDELNKYFKELEEYKSIENQCRRLFGMGTRALTSPEAKAFDQWINEYKIPFELIEYAYELTVSNTQKPSVPYATKIINSWHDMKISTVDEAKAVGKSKKDLSHDSSFDISEFSKAALLGSDK